MKWLIIILIVFVLGTWAIYQQERAKDIYPAKTDFLYLEGEIEACEYLGLDRERFGQLNIGEGIMTLLVATANKCKEIEKGE